MVATAVARSVGVGESIADLIISFCVGAECVGIDAYALPGARTAKNFDRSLESLPASPVPSFCLLAEFGG